MVYKLEYLPSARRDLVEIVGYISRKLQNPAAAEQLAHRLIEAGERLLEFPYSSPVYVPLQPLKHEYRRCVVENYLMFYWVEEEKKTITIARVIYAKRNYAPMLEG